MRYFSATEVRESANMTIAKCFYELKYLQKFKRLMTSEKKAEFMNEVLEQISVCEQLGCEISIEQIKAWIDTEDIGKVRAETYKIKFAS